MWFYLLTMYEVESCFLKLGQVHFLIKQ
jgi:hypothetical protein